MVSHSTSANVWTRSPTFVRKMAPVPVLCISFAQETCDEFSSSLGSWGNQGPWLAVHVGPPVVSVDCGGGGESRVHHHVLPGSQLQKHGLKLEDDPGFWLKGLDLKHAVWLFGRPDSHFSFREHSISLHDFKQIGKRRRKRQGGLCGSIHFVLVSLEIRWITQKRRTMFVEVQGLYSVPEGLFTLFRIGHSCAQF